MNLEGDVTMSCPGCKRAFEINLRQVYPGNAMTCEGCGARIEFTGDDGRKAAQSLKELRDAIDSLKRLGR